MSNTLEAVRVCRICGHGKQSDQFYKNYAQCKMCYGEKRKIYYRANRDKYIAQHRAYYDRAKDRVSRLNRESNLRGFGLTIEQYEEMFAAQGHGCALCAGMNRDGRRLAVDHDHATGIVRGLLCGECNQSLGKMKDSPSLLRKAAEYIEKKGKL